MNHECKFTPISFVLCNQTNLYGERDFRFKVTGRGQTPSVQY